MYNTPKPRGVTRIETALDDDLKPFSAHLWARRIPHRIYEQDGRQVLEVQGEAAAEHVIGEYRAWREGRLLLRETPLSAAPPWHSTAAAILKRYPCLAVVTVAAIVMYPATWSLTEHDEWGAWLPWMTIVDVTVSPPAGAAGALWDGLLSGQLWRLVTPSFLHFSLPHLGFNLAVVLGFGMRIERAAGTAKLALVIVAIAVASNLVQYAIIANGLFGGLSGVAYGLFAYVVVRGMREPHVRVWRTQKALVVSLLTFLVLMTTGVAEVFGLYIANAAHWTGLVIGGVLGYAATRRHA